jgi:hypothetical protein
LAEELDLPWDVLARRNSERLGVGHEDWRSPQSKATLVNAEYARTVPLLLAVASALLLRGGVGVHSASQVGMVRRRSRSMNRYTLSTFSRAQGVLCRTLRLDPMLGLVLKHWTEMLCARTSPP